ncbi:hypothetical protein HanIR_Chr17g0854001 [Helianthus annuus]|nr:hypothetical protein HanIR_Chr17g0854001 [Helianthus annuus]
MPIQLVGKVVIVKKILWWLQNKKRLNCLKQFMDQVSTGSFEAFWFVDDKYQYTSENKDLMVHGWISHEPPVGLWQITLNNEFKSGWPLKRNLYSRSFYVHVHST